MKSSQELAISIKEIAKAKKITIKKMLSDCGLSVNTLSSMQSGGYFPRLEAIAKIADYLDCSIDYLLGRNAFGDSISVSASNVNGSAVIQGKQTGGMILNTPSNAQNYGEEEAEILRILNTIGVKGRTELLSYAFALEEKHKGSA